MTLAVLAVPVHNFFMPLNAGDEIMWESKNADTHAPDHSPQTPKIYGIPVPFLRGR